MGNLNGLWYLEDMDLTQLLCPFKLPNLMDNPNTKNFFKKGEFIFFNKIDDKKYVYFIDQGKVAIGKYGSDGKEITKAILERGEVFGELSLISEESSDGDFALALEDTTVCMTASDELKSLMRNRNSLQVYFLQLIGNRLLKMEKRLESLVFKDSKTRVVEYILDLLNTKGSKVGFEYVIRNLPTHQQIANYTATSRQTVTTLLNDLREQGLLVFDRKRMLIRDIDKLKDSIHHKTA